MTAAWTTLKILALKTLQDSGLSELNDIFSWKVYQGKRRRTVFLCSFYKPPLSNTLSEPFKSWKCEMNFQASGNTQSGMSISWRMWGETNHTLTFSAGLRDGVSRALAHHLGNVDRTVHAVTKSDGTEHGLGLQLLKKELRKPLNLRDKWIDHNCIMQRP